MDKDKIIRMAIQCQLVNTSNREGIYMDALEAFAKLVWKEAISALVQEPTPACWHSDNGCPNRQACCDAQHCLYTTPTAAQRKWVELTDEEVDECYESVMFNADIEATRFLVYQAIEAKLREKNT